MKFYFDTTENTTLSEKELKGNDYFKTWEKDENENGNKTATVNDYISYCLKCKTLANVEKVYIDLVHDSIVSENELKDEYYNCLNDDTIDDISFNDFIQSLLDDFSIKNI